MVLSGQIEEVKLHLNGRRQSFDCQLVDASKRGLIISWRNEEAMVLGGFALPAGSLSHAFFWPGRRHNLYRFQRPDGTPNGWRIDIIEPALLEPGRVTYRDMILDIVIHAGQEPRLEDEDELLEAEGAGLIEPAAAEDLRSYARELLAGVDAVLAESEAWLAEALSLRR